MNTENYSKAESITSSTVNSVQKHQIIEAVPGQPHMLSIFQPTRRATAHLEIHLTNQQRSISLSYSAFSGVIVPSST
ncbi:hypothetical protein ACN9OJ_10020, partial [Glaesserella parasuis]|uniref:hypothetical protein n=1 Tax=Glaesserella parasuis TaxID=738 RepID=UPI003B685443